MLLNALLERPTSFTFADQGDNESVVLVVRAHPITQLSWVLGILFFGIVPLLLTPLFPYITIGVGIMGFLVLSWYALLFSVGFTSYFLWYFNLGIVTTKKVIDVDTGSVLYTDSSSTFLKDIEEINQSSQGILSATFDYGDVFVQTAGEKPNIEFSLIPRPSFMVQTINSLIDTIDSNESN